MSWLSRQSFLGADSDERLAGLMVAIGGLGGGGSHVAQQLAHVGVGGFVLIDDDRIDETNLNRLVGGTRQDVIDGTLKVDIAARVIRAINPEARVTVVPRKWQDALDDIRGVDAVFGCVDSVRAKDELETFSRRLLIPYVDQGMDVHEIEGGFLIAGQVVLSMPGGPCLRCLGVVTDEALDEEARNYGAAGGKPQVVWPNGVLASTAVGLFLQTMTPWHVSQHIGECLEYDGNLHTMQPSDRMRRRRDRPCAHKALADLGDPMFDVRQIVTAAKASVTVQPSEALVPERRWWTRFFRMRSQ
ncbi:MAG TPA: ThiF family adenylyltransferase [Sphingomonadaceae bacterium]|uniref:HesA/MoeB/ThiF family protein n=1 Tax=Pararhizobium sp. TaxID=1977563 RepID=UPI002C5F1BA8|nr:ThiF family adenylyltransferase [Pararhizobium sp.]HTN14475.1 ThiF family adenylyltransferase [Sphingomonadaceae bacterium]HTO32598.1 ThiF family adenylyltransferase [Pararhizobium sp.]